MNPITQEQMKRIAPSATKANIALYTSPLNQAMEVYEITTPRRQAAFIAQVLHESDSLRAVQEYASGIIYEGRKDLGNIHLGDGSLFRGRGLIQVTGRANYLSLSMRLYHDDRLIHNPTLLMQPEAAAFSACDFWKSRNLNNYCDKAPNWTTEVTWKKEKKTIDAFEWICYRVNGGFNGLEERKKIYAAALKTLNFV